MRAALESADPAVVLPWLVLIALGSLAAGCAPGGVGGGYRAPTGSMQPADPQVGDCDVDEDCGADVCRYVDGVRRCVEPGSEPPRGDGSECGPCPAPGECREGRCLQPDESGDVCEFDPECGADLWIAGRCTPDPRDHPCAATADCPVGFVCTAGMCEPTPGGGGDGCVADAECPAMHLCEAGRCIPEGLCAVTDPDLAGRWDVDTVLRLREALPPWLDGFLAAVAGPFHFIAGHSMSLGSGLPGWVESIVEPALRSWADRRLAPWQRQLMGAVADLNDILSTWTIEETMDLWAAGPLDAYGGRHTWTSVEFTYRGMPVHGRPEDIIDWRFEPSDFTARALCGTFVIDRHDVHVSIGAIIAWAVDAVVYEATDHRYATLSGALAAATSGFCDGLASAGDSAVDFPGVHSAIFAACSAELSRLSGELSSAIADARVGADLMTLKGSAPIVSGRLLTPGTWEGSLAGGDFTGEFSASR